MPSHSDKKTLQQRFDEAEHLYREAAEEVVRLDNSVKAERAAIEKLEGDYTAACRAIASGESADPATIIAEKDHRNDRARGLEVLLKEAQKRLQPLQDSQEAARRALQAENDRLEIERLEKAIVDTAAAQKKAEESWDETRKAHANAVHARWLFDHKPEVLGIRRNA